MGTCKHKKRLQIYLDGWMDKSETARFEKHLKECSICQSELLELEDVSSAALEIVDEAPETSYWDSFYVRTLNRIISRSVTPYEESSEVHRGLRLKIGSYSLAIVSLATILLVILNFLPDVLNLTPEKDLSLRVSTEQTVPVTLADVDKGSESVRSGLTGESEVIISQYVSEPAISSQFLSEPASIENGGAEMSDDILKSGAEILSYFKGNDVTERPELILSDLTDYSEGSTKTDYGKINEDLRLSSSMIAAGILSEAGDESNLIKSFDGRSKFSVAENGLSSFLNGASGNWGYLSKPPDSAEAEEFRRYLIELELIQTK